jgi:hypothetical protein
LEIYQKKLNKLNKLNLIFKYFINIRMENFKLSINGSITNFENERIIFLEHLKINNINPEDIDFKINNIKKVLSLMNDLIQVTKLNFGDQLVLDSIILLLSQLNKLNTGILLIKNERFNNFISGNILNYTKIQEKCIEFQQQQQQQTQHLFI